MDGNKVRLTLCVSPEIEHRLRLAAFGVNRIDTSMSRIGERALDAFLPPLDGDGKRRARPTKSSRPSPAA